MPVLTESTHIIPRRHGKMTRFLFGIIHQRRISGFNEADAFDDRLGGDFLGSSHDVLQRIRRLDGISTLYDDRPVIELFIHEVDAHTTFLFTVGQCPE